MNNDNIDIPGDYSGSARIEQVNAAIDYMNAQFVTRYEISAEDDDTFTLTAHTHFSDRHQITDGMQTSNVVYADAPDVGTILKFLAEIKQIPEADSAFSESHALAILRDKGLDIVLCFDW